MCLRVAQLDQEGLILFADPTGVPKLVQWQAESCPWGFGGLGAAPPSFSAGGRWPRGVLLLPCSVWSPLGGSTKVVSS